MLTRSTLAVTAALACAALIHEAGATQPPDSVVSDTGTDTAMGGFALYLLGTGYQNTAAGYIALLNMSTGYKSSAFGYAALANNWSGSDNAAFGANALFMSNGSLNSGFGADALCNLGSTGTQNTAVGSEASYSSTAGSTNVSVGAIAMYSNTDGDLNTSIGYSAMYSSQAGWFNTAVGDGAMLQSQGSYNTAVGTSALLGAYEAGGVENVAVGEGVLQRCACDGNTGIGAESLRANSTGEFNIAMGFEADSFPNTGSNNIEIGNVGAGPDEILASTTPYDTNVIKIGTPGMQTKAFIAGIYGTSVSNANAVMVNSQGQLGVAVSSQRFKTRIATMEDPDKLSRLRPVTFHIKVDPQGIRQYGLIAEEVARVYPDLVIRDEHGRIDGVRYDELVPILLRKLQLQDAKIRDWQAQVAKLGDLRTQIADARAALVNARLAANR